MLFNLLFGSDRNGMDCSAQPATNHSSGNKISASYR